MAAFKVLCIGDVVGNLGRRGVKQLVPKLRKDLGLDLVIANIENLAHGKGITEKTLSEIAGCGIDVFTSGNHIWRRVEGLPLLESKTVNILRPANYPEGSP